MQTSCTPRISPFSLTEPRMNVFVRSEGCSDPGITGCGKAFIKVNQQGYSLHSRGVNVVVFSAKGNLPCRTAA